MAKEENKWCEITGRLDFRNPNALFLDLTCGIWMLYLSSKYLGFFECVQKPCDSDTMEKDKEIPQNGRNESVCKTMLLSEQEAVLKEFWLILDFWNIYFVQPPFTSQYWVDWFLALWAESRALDLAFKVFYWRHVVKMKVSVIEESREPIWWAPDWNGFSCYQRPSSTATRYTLTYTVMYTKVNTKTWNTKLYNSKATHTTP